MFLVTILIIQNQLIIEVVIMFLYLKNERKLYLILEIILIRLPSERNELILKLLEINENLLIFLRSQIELKIPE